MTETQDARLDPLGDLTRAMPEIKITGAQLMDLIEERDRWQSEARELRDSIGRIGYRILEGSFTRGDGKVGRFYLESAAASHDCTDCGHDWEEHGYGGCEHLDDVGACPCSEPYVRGSKT